SCLGAGPEATPPSSLSESDWAAIRADRDAAIQRYLNAAGDGYRWFAHSLHGEGAGAPFLLMQVFPELAPDIWGPPGERTARLGFIDDPKAAAAPLPMGLGWVLDPVRGDGVARDFHSAALTCAACHVGRVRVAPDHYLLLVGAPNTQIDVRKFRRAVE